MERPRTSDLPGRVPPGVRLLIVAWLVAGVPGLATAQQPGETPAPRLVTVTGGVGNAMGWLGFQGERYFRDERLSVFVGAGYLPEGDSGDASGMTFAGGVRVYTAGLRHRAFLEPSVSQLSVDLACFDDCRRYYGPGVQAGYQYVSRRGLTVLASFGVGYAPGLPEGESKAGTLGGLGLGYTWRD